MMKWDMRRGCGVAGLALIIALAAPTTSFAQDALKRAKDLYASASYEEALQVLDTLKDSTPSTEASAYSVFCLVALGRKDEARNAIESIVRADPLFKPSEGQVSPRIRAFFDEIRKPHLPDAARDSYTRGKAAFDRKDWAGALAEFDRTMTLVDEASATDASVSDLKVLADGFRDLARTNLLPPPAPKASPSVVPPAAEPTIYGPAQTAVMKPVPVAKPLPPWHPTAVEAKMTFSGEIELIISETGQVLSAKLVRTVNARYDASLLDAAKLWTFQPATKDGVPVRYRYSVAVNLGK
jgi:tetratricopeptide (TPR) repeat protein